MAAGLRGRPDLPEIAGMFVSKVSKTDIAK